MTLALARSIELFARPAGSRHADHGEIELAAPGHRLEGRKDLLVGQVAGCTEEDERVCPRFDGIHGIQW